MRSEECKVVMKKGSKTQKMLLIWILLSAFSVKAMILNLCQ